MIDEYTEFGYRGAEEVRKLKNEIIHFKKQIAEETKEKYTLLKRIKELGEELAEKTS